MAVETEEIALGFEAPDFRLLNTLDGKMTSLRQLQSDKATVVMFICNHCPYVVHVLPGIIQLAGDYLPRGVSFIAISSNDVATYPQDGPDKMKELGEAMQLPFPYLHDETQEVARAYHAACTPDFSIFDGRTACVYRGRMDGSTPGNGVPVSGADIRNALDRLLEGQAVDPVQRPSLGCSIKWR